MMRSLVVLLLLALFFLTGMVVGMDRDGQQAATIDKGAEKTDTITEPSETDKKMKVTKVNDKNNDQIHNEAELKPKASDHFIQKAASFLEAGITGVYELVVRMAYQLAQVFF
ncbi:hypothetical protein EU245_00775 [Lentibacillus lipolyticus]|nr:hypothetical protein EU245_00775 [Lentibacillus lipolyticus]